MAETALTSHKRAKKVATFRFYEELNDFLPKKRRKVEFEISFFGKPAIKDIIESLGVPHAEVDLVLANGQSVKFDYRLADGDRISVYPVFESLDISKVTHLRPEPLRVAKFICDVHLGRLARQLRMLGFDTLYKNDYADSEIARIAGNEKRIILTRDIGLLKIGIVTRGYWVRSSNSRTQIREILERFDLFSQIKPFIRCMECNDRIVKVKKESIVERIPAKTARYYNAFYTCRGCDRIYWQGSHFEKMQAFIATLTACKE